jgi:hypothetical protein
MTAFDVVHDRLDFAIGRLVEARIASDAHHKKQPLRQIHKFGDDPKGEALYADEQDALVRLVAAFHYAEQVGSGGYDGESSLDFERRERRLAKGDEVITSNRDDSEGETRLEQLGKMYYEEQERCRAEARTRLQ